MSFNKPAIIAQDGLPQSSGIMKVSIHTTPDKVRKQILAVMKATVDASAESDMERVAVLEGLTELLDDILVQIDKGE